MGGGRYGLLGTTMVPGFDYEDFELGDREKLTKLFPSYVELTKRLTR
ncbi:MAG: hypothetical protein Q8O92_04405 [Candidatus Latescibacter sp.]|nr:hypothetical protein [Candidatus Latescibacter sp.]